MKFLFRFSAVLLGIFLLLSLIGMFMRHKWGRDVAELDVTEGSYHFTAKRNEWGVWKFKVKDVDSLSFAFGYIHNLDREFQAELLRRASSGRLSSIFDESMLKRDRLLRFLVRPSKKEWEDTLREKDPLKESVIAYAAGRNSYLQAPTNEAPLEYKIFSLKREEVAPLEPWEVLGASRFHSWQFSTDYRDEILRKALSEVFGSETAALMTPAESPASPALYDQVLVKAYVKSAAKSPEANAKNLKSILPTMYQPEPEKTTFWEHHFNQEKALHSQAKSEVLDQTLTFGSIGAASNSWVIADPRVGRPLTLCNDTHLDFSYPSALYPVEYELDLPDERVEVSGFSLPGTPFVLIGRYTRTKKETGKSSILITAITIADYADTQDLVQLSENTLAKGISVTESFEVRDPQSGLKKETKFKETWTPFGPRVDEIIDLNAAKKTSGPLALDWLGYRNGRSPLHFFRKRNLFGEANLERDLYTDWAFPSVNYSHISRDFDGKLHVGHQVTGMIYEDESPLARSKRREFSSEASASKRKISYPWQRAFIDFEYLSKEPVYFASGNQRIWKGDAGLTTAFIWNDSTRADRIVEKYDQNVLAPEFSQSDFYSKDLAHFVAEARQLASADSLCSNLEADFLSPCMELLSKLDQWNGEMDQNRWEPTLAALWKKQSLVKLWPKNVGGKISTDNEEESDLFRWWSNSNIVDRSLRNLMSKKTRWEALTKQKISLVLSESFGESLQLLMKNFGPTVEQWNWSQVHQLEWQHPFGRIPGSLGPLLRDAFLGPPRAVSGYDDSPGSTSVRWQPQKPLHFPAVHGAVMRYCADIETSGKSTMKWANVTGASGNPFSEWAWKFSNESWFQNKLLPVTSEIQPTPKK